MLVWLSRLPVGSSASSERRLVDQGAGDGDALLLAAGKLVGVMVGARAEADEFERAQGALLLLARLDAMAVVKHRHLDVFQRRRAREQVETLEDEADFFVADIRQRIPVERGNVNAIEQIIAAARTVQRADHVHQRAFAGATRAHERHEFARENFQRNPAHGMDVHFAGVIHLVDVRKLDDRIGLHGKI